MRAVAVVFGMAWLEAEVGRRLGPKSLAVQISPPDLGG
jgi:hypothetical protein